MASHFLHLHLFVFKIFEIKQKTNPLSLSLSLVFFCFLFQNPTINRGWKDFCPLLYNCHLTYFSCRNLFIVVLTFLNKCYFIEVLVFVCLFFHTVRGFSSFNRAKNSWAAELSVYGPAWVFSITHPVSKRVWFTKAQSFSLWHCWLEY